MNDGGLGFGKRALIDKIIETNWGLEKNEFSKNELLYIIQEMTDEDGKAYLTKEVRTGASSYRVYKEFVKYLLYRNLANYDSMVLVSGIKGTGKSSAAIMLARQWCSLLGIKFDPKRHIAYNNADIMNKIDMLKPFEPIICVGQNSRVRIRKDGVTRSIEIKKLVGMKDYEVLSYNIKKDSFEYKKPEKTVFTKRDKTYTLELENGLKLIATGNHLVLTKSGYKRMDELTEEDEVVLDTNKCIYCGKEYFSNQWDGIACSKECRRLHRNATAWGKLNPEKAGARRRFKYKENFNSDINYRIKHNIITRLPNEVLKVNLFEGKNRFERTLGCSIEFFKKYLEKRFRKGMSWDNYGSGNGKWSIDHKIPIRDLDFKGKSNFKEILHYSNIRPIWSLHNSNSYPRKEVLN